MTISLVPEDSRRRRFVCTGGETAFNITFPVFAASDVQVVRLRNGVTTTLAQPADYTVAGAGNQAGFTVTLTAAAQAGDVIVVLSAQPVSRTSEWTDGQALRAQALNAEFARWWIALQQSKRDVDRTIRLSATDAATGAELPPASERAGRLLGFDPVTGAPVAVTPNPGNLVISAQGEALIAAATPSAARQVIDAASSADVAGRVAKSGDTMTGPLTLPGAPTAALHAATKQYVDDGVGQSSNNVTLTGGAVEWTGIPSWANRVVLTAYDVSLAGAGRVFLRISNSATYPTSGYNAAMSVVQNNVSTSSQTSEFPISWAFSHSTVSNGAVKIDLFRVDATQHIWFSISHAIFLLNGISHTCHTIGWIGLSGPPLDRLMLSADTSTFSSGVARLSWAK